MSFQQKAAIRAAVADALLAIGIERLRSEEFFGMRQGKRVDEIAPKAA